MLWARACPVILKMCHWVGRILHCDVLHSGMRCVTHSSAVSILVASRTPLAVRQPPQRGDVMGRPAPCPIRGHVSGQASSSSPRPLPKDCQHVQHAADKTHGRAADSPGCRVGEPPVDPAETRPSNRPPDPSPQAPAQALPGRDEAGGSACHGWLCSPDAAAVQRSSQPPRPYPRARVPATDPALAGALRAAVLQACQSSAAVSGAPHVNKGHEVRKRCCVALQTCRHTRCVVIWRLHVFNLGDRAEPCTP